MTGPLEALRALARRHEDRLERALLRCAPRWRVRIRTVSTIYDGRLFAVLAVRGFDVESVARLVPAAGPETETETVLRVRAWREAQAEDLGRQALERALRHVVYVAARPARDAKEPLS